MGDHREGSAESEGVISATSSPAEEVPAQAAADRAAELWKLLGVDEAPAPDRATTGGAVEPGEPAVSELVARAWYDADPDALNGVDAPADGGDSAAGASWTVDRLPTAAEGGVAAMFTAGAALPPGPERARLSAMIEHLPDQPLPRVGPQDIQMETPYVAPVAIWFWGDDDIYPGRGSSTARQQPSQAPQPTKKRRRR
jgi:hypothetical protein